MRNIQQEILRLLSLRNFLIHGGVLLGGSIWIAHGDNVLGLTKISLDSTYVKGIKIKVAASGARNSGSSNVMTHNHTIRTPMAYCAT